MSVYVDAYPICGSVWRALADSADAMPPLFQIATRDAEPGGLRPAEVVMAIGFLLIPFAVLASSLLITGMFYLRYGLTAMFGLMFAAVELLRRLCPRRRAVAAAFSSLFQPVAGVQRGLDISSNCKQLPTAA